MKKRTGWKMLTAVIVTNKEHPKGPTPIMKFSAIPSGASKKALWEFPSLRRVITTEQFYIDFDDRTIVVRFNSGLADCGKVGKPKRFGADFGIYVAS
jgi:hypothetical protein